MNARVRKRQRTWAVVVLAAVWAGDALACDDLAGKLLTAHLDPAIKSLGCSALGRAGLDNAEHKLESVCYTSTGPTSTVQIVAGLTCRTSDAAFIKTSLSERVTAEARVRGSDCLVEDVSVKPSGEIGKIFAQAFDLQGRARAALQDALAKVCSMPK